VLINSDIYDFDAEGHAAFAAGAAAYAAGEWESDNPHEAGPLASAWAIGHDEGAALDDGPETSLNFAIAGVN